MLYFYVTGTTPWHDSLLFRVSWWCSSSWELTQHKGYDSLGYRGYDFTNDELGCIAPL